MGGDSLQVLFRERLYRHPILAAMASRVDWAAAAAVDNAVTATATFDGPALPEKLNAQVLLPTFGSTASRETIGRLVDDFLDQCEVRIADQMRRSGTGR